MSVILIAAVTKNGVIGKDNGLVWRNAEDMKRFKRLTTGKTVLMGRKTWESLPEKFRPLPDRVNVVITRRADFPLPQGVLRFGSVEQAVAELRGKGDICVIGGGEIYALALPLADKLEITHVNLEVEGDTRFPDIDPSIWEIVTDEPQPLGGFRFTTYTRRGTVAP